MFDAQDFYPTPQPLIEKMLDGITLSEIGEVLDLGAGRGDIGEYIVEAADRGYYSYQRSAAKIDAVELNPDFQHILRGKGFRLIHDDILTFETHKVYDLIVANFPFSIGAECLQKALSLVERGGGHLRCLVNAETLKNPHTRLRETVNRRLEDLGAEVEYLAGEFECGERPTSVECALIKLHVERPAAPSIILDTLKRAPDVQIEEERAAQLVSSNFMARLVAGFNVECRFGITIIEEYFALKPYITDRFRADNEEYDYSKELIELKVEGAYKTKQSHINCYLSGVRYKYWSLLLNDPRFHGSYTSNILSELQSKLTELRDYDFTLFNIQALTEEMSGKIVAGIEASILALFDKCTRKFTYDESIHSGNVHYYTGWKTNKAHKINKKIILPINGLCAYGADKLDYRIREELSDMVKVFNYLSEEKADVRLLVGQACQSADNRRNFSGIDLRYFDVTFYKKGTAHIRFKDKRLLDKFNIFGSQRKGWLPPAYGKKPYERMGTEEREVIDSFQGREAYAEVVEDSKFYIVESTDLLQLGPGAPEQEKAPEQEMVTEVEKAEIAPTTQRETGPQQSLFAA